MPWTRTIPCGHASDSEVGVGDPPRIASLAAASGRVALASVAGLAGVPVGSVAGVRPRWVSLAQAGANAPVSAKPRASGLQRLTAPRRIRSSHTYRPSLIEVARTAARSRPPRKPSVQQRPDAGFRRRRWADEQWVDQEGGPRSCRARAGRRVRERARCASYLGGSPATAPHSPRSIPSGYTPTTQRRFTDSESLSISSNVPGPTWSPSQTR